MKPFTASAAAEMDHLARSREGLLNWGKDDLALQLAMADCIFGCATNDVNLRKISGRYADVNYLLVRRRWQAFKQCLDNMAQAAAATHTAQYLQPMSKERGQSTSAASQPSLPSSSAFLQAAASAAVSTNQQA